VILTADHVRHLHQRIIDDDGEVVGGNTVRPDEDGIADHIGVKRDLAADDVVERDVAPLGHAQTHDRRFPVLFSAPGFVNRDVAAGAGVFRRQSCRELRFTMRFEQLSRAKAVITLALGEQPMRVIGIRLHALGLPIWTVRAPRLHSFVPLETHPSQIVKDRLLTPFGLRSLAPGHRDYKAQYYGDLRSRDAAYHQGTVWGWLIGPFVDAWLKLYPDDKAGARKCLEGFEVHLSDAGVGTLSEIFDAEAPYLPRGCMAQAWTVAEVLRAWLLTNEAPVSQPSTSS